MTRAQKKEMKKYTKKSWFRKEKTTITGNENAPKKRKVGLGEKKLQN